MATVTLKSGGLAKAIALTACVVAVSVVSFSPIASATTPKTTGLSLSSLESQITKAAAVKKLPTLVVPLSKVPTDNPEGLSKGCLIAESATTALGSRPLTCYFGDLSTKKTLILFGDSQAWMWLPAFNELGKSKHFRVELDARAGCEVADLPMFDNSTTASAEACSAFRTWFFNRVKSLHPFVTIIADYEYTEHANYSDQPYTQSSYDAALAETVSTIKTDGSKPVFLSPPPPQTTNPAVCLSIHVSDIQECNVPIVCLTGTTSPPAACQFVGNPSVSISNIVNLSKTVTSGHGTYINLEKLFCTTKTCPVVIDKISVFFDQVHLSTHYNDLAEPALGKLIPSADL